MTVKVLQFGDSIFPKRIICQNCGTLLEIGNALDLKIEETEPNSGRRAFVKCLWCDKKVFLYLADQPQALAEYDKQIKNVKTY